MASSSRAYATILITALIAISFGAAFVGRHLASPSDGARLEPGGNALTSEGVILTPLQPQPGGLRAGDLVVAVEGRGLESWAQSLLQPRSPSQTWEVGDRLRYTVLRDGGRLDIAVTLGRYPFWAIVGRNWGTIAFAAASLIVAAFVFVRRPEHPAGRILFLGAACLTSSTAWSFGLQISDFTDGRGFWLFKISTLIFYNLYWTAGLHFALIFPRPLPVLHGRRWLIPAVYAVPYVMLLIYIAAARSDSTGVLDWFSRWRVAEGAHAAVVLTLALAALFWQYRRHQEGVSRQQIRWLAFAGLVSGGAGLMFYILPGALGLTALGPNVIGLIVLPYPIAIAIAILRHNLFDIDRLINRALVYGALTGSVVMIYVLFVGALGVLFQSQGNSLISLAATGIVAVLFYPLRERLQRGVNRLMYGERDDPYTVLTRLGRRLEASLTPDDVLSTIVETIAQTLKLPYVAIALKQVDEIAIVATYGLRSAESVHLPLAYRGETIGQLILSPRAPDEPFTPAEQRLLEDIAHQISVAAHAVRLTNDLRRTAADLQRSRERLIAAREEERRRLRRDLHDGLGPTLAAQALKAGSARALLAQRPAAADRLLAELESGIEAALADIRRLVYDLRPPELDELGLVGAIHESAARYGARWDASTFPANGATPRISVEAPDRLPPLPAAAEVAVYRIVQEALTNVVRHARARTCQVRLAVDDRLHLTISDDGIGLPAERRAGVGLTSMRERAAELGGSCAIEPGPRGGTRVVVQLPVGG